jgi:hypothetical protein
MQTINSRLLVAVGAAAMLCHSSLGRAQPTGPDLRITLTHSGNFTVGVNGTYTIGVSNIGGAASGGTSVGTQDFNSLSATGPGWICEYTVLSIHRPRLLTCLNGPIPPGGSAPPLTLTVLPDVAGTFTEHAYINGPGGDIATDVTIVLPSVPTLPQWALVALTVCLALAGVVALRRRTT